MSTVDNDAHHHGALASVVRRRLLVHLSGNAAPYDVYQLAEALGLHVTTVRFHLDVLTRAGLVETRRRARLGAGRPRTVYEVTNPPAQLADDPYQILSTLLAANFADDPTARAERGESAGKAWASALVTAPSAKPMSATDPSMSVAEQVTAVFAELGFDPDLSLDDDARPGAAHIWLRACPFRAVARAYPEVVCSLHRGLLIGTLSRLGTATEGARLEPFVGPDTCCATL